MKKIICLSMIVFLLATTFSTTSFATNESKFELYAIQYTDGVCTLSGRYFTKSNTRIILTAKEEDGETVCGEAISNSDGRFSISFPAVLTKYQVQVQAGNGEQTGIFVDLSSIEEFFSLKNGYRIASVTFTNAAVVLEGMQDVATTGTLVAMKILKGDTIQSLEESQIDEAGRFVLRFKVSPGEYTVDIKVDGKEHAYYRYTETGLCTRLAVDEENYTKFIKKLNGYVEELDTLKTACNLQDISTDYEEINLEIIRKFIVLLQNEAEHGDFSRMGQYHYALTKLYEDAKGSMESYLDGEKTPFSASRYRTGSLTLDGTSVIGTAETEGKREEKPVFFVGYGNWAAVAEDIPFFSSLGLNAIQTELEMWKVLAPFKAYGWECGTNLETEVTVQTFHEETNTENTVLAIENEHAHVFNVYTCLNQVVDVEPNTTYLYGLQAKANEIENLGAWFSINGKNVTGRKQIRSSENWEEYQFSYTTGSEETTVDFTILFEGIIQDLYIDNCYLKKSGSQENLLTNGDFEIPFEPQTPLEQEAAEEGIYFNESGIQWLREALERAEQYHVLVDIGIVPHCMPYFIYASSENASKAETGYLPFALDDERVRTAISLYARLIASVASEYDSVHSLCLTNEPTVQASNSASRKYYSSHWQAYLQERYGTVDAMNQAYGSSYDSFQQVEMPGYIEATPVYYDYRNFNDQLLTEFHCWYTEAIRKEYPELKLHAKVMDYFHYNYSKQLFGGTDYEKMADSMDLNGCDGFSYYPGADGTPLSLKMGWFDLMTSIKDKPVWDTESHIMSDQNVPVYDDLTPAYTAADIWNGAIHGRGAAILWQWELLNSAMPWSGSNFPNANAAFRPLDLAAVARTAMDLNRLSEEVTALQKERAKVGLLYSRTSLGYNNNHMVAAADAYDSIIFSGQKVGFVTDSCPEEMHQYSLLVVPDVTHVSASTLTCMMEYIQNGGEVLLLGENSLKKNEYNKEQDVQALTYIYENADKESSVSEKIQEMGLSSIQLIDAETGKQPENVEWSYTEYDGRYLIHIANYDLTNTKNLKVFQDGREVKYLGELRSGTQFDSICAKPMDALLVAFDTMRFDLLHTDGTVKESNISEIQSGTVSYHGPEQGTVILAFYKDDQLVTVTIDKGKIEIPELTKGNYRLMAFEWDLKNMQPLTKCKKMITEVTE